VRGESEMSSAAEVVASHLAIVIPVSSSQRPVFICC
jgi:hypothetical protein